MVFISDFRQGSLIFYMQRKIRNKIDKELFLHFNNKKQSVSDDFQGKWGEAIACVLNHYKDTLKYKLIIYRYALSQNEVQICMALNIEKTTLYNWINEIITVTLIFASIQGLVEYDFHKKELSLK